MHTLNKNAYVLAICLSVLAGCVDAIGFLSLGGYFISFMSGNSTRLAVNLATGDLHAALFVAAILVTFVLGTMVGVFVRHFSKPSLAVANVLAMITLLLAAAATSHEMGWGVLATGCMTLAMGAENAVLQRGGEVVVGVTYMTGTLVKIGQRLANALLGGDALAWAPYLLLWLGLISGGVIGTLLFYVLGLHGLWVAALWAAILTVVAVWSQHRLAI